METGTPLEDAAERLANNLAAHNAPLPPEQRLSLSMGITSCREEPLCSIDRLITEADARMYAEKDAKKRRRR
jgi:GGDEF domain-containing protein